MLKVTTVAPRCWLLFAALAVLLAVPACDSSGSDEDTTAPSPPSGLSASASGEIVELSWEAPGAEDVSSYQIYRDTKSSPTEQVATVGDAAYTDTEVEAGQTYYYRVKAEDEADNESGFSGEAQAMLGLPAPTGLTAEVGSGSVVLTWQAVQVEGLGGYRIYRGTEPEPTTQVASAEAGATSYTDAGVDDGQTYFYRITAVKGDNESGFSGEATATVADETTPAPPTDLQAEGGNEEVQLSWTASSASDAASYRIYRGTEPGPTTQVAEVNASERSYTDADVENETQYYYRLRTLDEAGNLSSFSDEASATPADEAAPQAPSDLSASPGNEQVQLDWSASADSDVAGYRVYRSTSSPADETLATVEVGQTSYTDAEVENGTEYFYRVTAFDEAENESGFSNEAQATPSDETAPAAPAGLAAEVTGIREIQITWNASSDSDVTGYRIYRGSSASSLTLLDETTETSYTDGDAPRSETLYYRVTALDEADNESDRSDAASVAGDTQAPLAPSNPQAAARQNGINVTWEAVDAEDIAEYRVYRGTSPAPTNKVAVVEGASFTDTDVSAGTEYYYRVRAVDFAGNLSDYSDAPRVTSATPGVIFVDAGAPAGGTGAAWGSAYRYLQDALDIVNGDPSLDYEVRIAEGVYYGDEDADGDQTDGDRNAFFRLGYDNGDLLGGYPSGGGERQPEENVTVLSGDIGQDDVTNSYGVTERAEDQRGTNSRHALVIGGPGFGSATRSTVVDGLTLTAGNDDAGDYGGGGLYCEGVNGACNPQIRNVRLLGNAAPVGGGGAYLAGDNFGEASPLFENVVVSGNANGGVVFSYDDDGTGDLTFTNVVFSGNSGGGLVSRFSSILQDPASITLNNVLFDDDALSVSGIALDITITNSSFFSSGGAVIRTTGDLEGLLSMSVQNSIIWSDSAVSAEDIVFLSYTFFDIGNTLVLGGVDSIDDITPPDVYVTDRGGNIDADPQFFDPDSPAGPDGIFGTADDGLRLQSGSPAIDAGDNAAVPADVDEDLKGNDRIVNGTVDMGPYEKQ